MKKVLTLLLVISSTICLKAQETEVVSMYDFGVDGISNQRLVDRVMDATSQAIKKSGFDVRRNNDFLGKAKQMDEIARLEKDVQKILTAHFIENGKAMGKKDIQAIRKFRMKVGADIVLIGKLQRNAHSESREYELNLHFVRLETSKYEAGPVTIIFRSIEIENSDVLLTKILYQLQKERFYGANLLPEDRINKKNLKRKIHLLCWLELWFSEDYEIIENLREVRSHTKTAKLYYSEKALTWSKITERLMQQETEDYLFLKKVFEGVIDSYHNLAILEESNTIKHRAMLQNKRRYETYFDRLNELNIVVDSIDLKNSKRYIRS